MSDCTKPTDGAAQKIPSNAVGLHTCEALTLHCDAHRLVDQLAELVEIEHRIFGLREREAELHKKLGATCDSLGPRVTHDACSIMSDAFYRHCT